MPASEGSFSFSNTLADIDAAFAWLAGDEVRRRFNIDPAKIVLGGHSFGGGMAMVYAATHPSAPRRLIGVAPSDVGESINGLLTDPATQESMRKTLSTPGAVPVRITDLESTIAQIKADGNRYWLKDAAPRLAKCSVLIAGGSEDAIVRIDQTLTPFVQALKGAGANVTFLSYPSDHQFRSVTQQLSSDIADWLSR